MRRRQRITQPVEPVILRQTGASHTSQLLAATHRENSIGPRVIVQGTPHQHTIRIDSQQPPIIAINNDTILIADGTNVTTITRTDGNPVTTVAHILAQRPHRQIQTPVVKFNLPSSTYPTTLKHPYLPTTSVPLARNTKHPHKHTQNTTTTPELSVRSRRSNAHRRQQGHRLNRNKRTLHRQPQTATMRALKPTHCKQAQSVRRVRTQPRGHRTIRLPHPRTTGRTHRRNRSVRSLAHPRNSRTAPKHTSHRLPLRTR